MNNPTITAEMLRTFNELTKNNPSKGNFRFAFLDTFPVSAIVPPEKYNLFRRIAAFFYDKESDGYKGILAEIDERISISRKTGRPLKVNDFLKHTDKETDYYDPSIRKSFELKTGCGDWMIDKNGTTLDKIIAIYTRKRRLIHWKYDFEPEGKYMNGKKSVKEGNETDAERSNPKKAGIQYPIHIDITASYKKFFDYLRLYPAGIQSFFKLSSRCKYEEDEEGNVICSYVWQMQTIKNSKKKIAFLEHFPVWAETGLTIEEYKAQEEEEE